MVMVKQRSKTSVQQILVRLRGGEELLVVRIEIDCGACGTHLLELHGHHIAAVVEGLTETLKKYPHLCGTVEERSTRVLLEGVVDPRKVGLN